MVCYQLLLNTFKIEKMELTEEVLKARAERKARREETARQTAEKRVIAKAAAVVADRELVERIKAEYPVQLAEFNRLKKLKAEYRTDKFDEALHWLQMEMTGEREWKWYGIGSDIGDFNEAEKEIINGVASKYYEALENRLWAGENADISTDELIRLIEEAGVDTFERADKIYNTFDGVSQSSRVYVLLNEMVYEYWIDQQDHLPEELQY